MSARADRLRFARLLAQQWRPLALALLLALFALFAAFALLAFSGHFITAAAIAGAGASAAAFDIFRPGAMIRLFAIVRTAGRYGERLVSHDAVLRLMQQLRARMHARLALLTPEPLARWSEGDLLQRLVSDVDALQEAPLRAGLPLVSGITVVAAAIGVAAWADARFVMPVAVALMTAALLVPLLTASRSLADGRALARQAALRRDALVDLLRGLTTLLLCGAWPRERAAWLAADRDVLSAQLAQRIRESVGQALAMLAIGAGVVVVVAPSPAGPSNAPAFAAVVLAVVATAEALAPLTASWLSWGRARASAQRIDALLANEPAIAFPPTSSLPPARGALELRGAGHRYAGRDAGLAETTLSLAAGARLHVSGASGVGKSTLAALLVRSLDPTAGEILLDGVALRDYDEAALRARVALLPQRPHLFATSVVDNLRLADPDADDARLRAVLRAVSLDAWLEQLPQGLATPLGEYGVGLSGGEARRLALARTLLRPAVLFVLDEPYEGLDAALRRRVADGVDAWLGDATLVLISHHAAAPAAGAVRLALSPRRV